MPTRDTADSSEAGVRARHDSGVRDDIGKVMIIGSGPITIGEAAEFDYSGSQACKALQEEGIEVVLVNSNPATIMTDPDMADAVYIEPMDPEHITEIITEERPDGIAAGLGGQTALNTVSELAENGVLEEYDVEILGCSLDTIETTEDRDLFKQKMHAIDEPVAKSKPVNSVDAALEFAEEVGYPVVVRPAYTLGGSGGGHAEDADELERIAGKGISLSRIDQVLVEESMEGWKEYEYELMRDGNDTTITVVNMENIDPVGVHTGDSAVVAPSQTLTDRKHHELRDAALKIIRALDIEGGCNIQFSVNPETREYRVIEVNPRVSRSSALASKATGYPIARVAAKIAVGKDLHEIENDITKETPASFEPMVDYTVVKIPRWPFEKLMHVEDSLTTQMKATGEAMAIGRTLEEALQKAVRSLDISGIDSFTELDDYEDRIDEANSLRLLALYTALRNGASVDELVNRTGIDPFYIQKLKNVADTEERLETADTDSIEIAKRNGFTDADIADATGTDRTTVTDARWEHGIEPTYKMVDTCAGEFAAATPFYYSAYEEENEVDAPDDEAVLVVGGGPIRIGQGIEFDYSCVHAVRAADDIGVRAMMVNNNPETVSTDYDVSDTLLFEPLTVEDVANIVEQTGADKVMTQFGGQTSVDLTVPLQEELDRRGVDAAVAGTPPDQMDAIEDREKFDARLRDRGIQVPDSGTARSFDEARQVASEIGYPVLVRPSYVIGGRAMQVVQNETELEQYIEEAVSVSPDHPILIDAFLDGAIELDVDAVSDGDDVLIGGVMEHIEHAGVHSGDSACVLPPQQVADETVEEVKQIVRDIADLFDIMGFLNVQLAVQDGDVYVLEANPRASRTIPYVSKHTGIPLATLAAKVMMGEKLADLDVEQPDVDHVSVKEAVFPFDKFETIDMNLSPEMRSTGEVMGIGPDMETAYAKAQIAAGNALPDSGDVLVVPGEDDVNTQIRALRDAGYAVTVVDRSGAVDEMDYDFVVDLSGTNPVKRAALDNHVSYVSTKEALDAAVDAMQQDHGTVVQRISDRH